MYQLKDGEEGNNILKSKRLCGKQTNKKNSKKYCQSKKGSKKGADKGSFLR